MSSPQQGGGESAAFGPPPQYAPGPQYDTYAQTQFDAPVPPGAAPQYGGPMPPGGYFYPAPPPRKNGFAVAGFILCFTVLLGIIFSILGLVRSGRVGGKGRGLAIAGLVLSVLFAGGFTALGIAAAKSPALDPGCTSVESSLKALEPRLTADGTQLNGNSTDPAVVRSELAAFTADVRDLKSTVDSSLAKAKHQSVKDRLQAVDADLAAVLTGLSAVEQGDNTTVDQLDAAANRIESDGNSLDDLCNTF
jgi:hypothetical protein